MRRLFYSLIYINFVLIIASTKEKQIHKNYEPLSKRHKSSSNTSLERKSTLMTNKHTNAEAHPYSLIQESLKNKKNESVSTVKKESIKFNQNHKTTKNLKSPEKHSS